MKAEAALSIYTYDTSMRTYHHIHMHKCPPRVVTLFEADRRTDEGRTVGSCHNLAGDTLDTTIEIGDLLWFL
jgi:hypothetical protein